MGRLENPLAFCVASRRKVSSSSLGTIRTGGSSDDGREPAARRPTEILSYFRGILEVLPRKYENLKRLNVTSQTSQSKSLALNLNLIKSRGPSLSPIRQAQSPDAAPLMESIGGVEA